MASRDLVMKVDEFTIIRRPPLTEEMRALTAERDRLTQGFLREAPEPPAAGVLSGTFLYAHPPDYRGRPTVDWGEREWRELFVELKEIGIHLGILQAAAWLDFGECYYPSQVLRGLTTWNILDPMLAAADAEKMTIYLGVVGLLYTGTELGVESKDKSKAVEAAKREVACYRELLARYRGAFHGYYLSPETGYEPGSGPFHMTCWHEFFERVTNEVKAATPDLPIVTSPYTSYKPDAVEATAEYLTALHRGCPMDAFAPQDSIGTFNNLSFLETGLGIWKRVAAAVGAEFWVNCESFSIADFGGPVCTIVPAEPKRFRVQLATAARLGAKKLVTWEAPYFLAKGGDVRARDLRQAYAEHRAKALVRRG
jgi:hypothetical protein